MRKYVSATAVTERVHHGRAADLASLVTADDELLSTKRGGSARMRGVARGRRVSQVGQSLRNAQRWRAQPLRLARDQ